MICQYAILPDSDIWRLETVCDLPSVWQPIDHHNLAAAHLANVSKRSKLIQASFAVPLREALLVRPSIGACLRGEVLKLNSSDGAATACCRMDS